jgi:hypothetical protein
MWAVKLHCIQQQYAWMKLWISLRESVLGEIKHSAFVQGHVAGFSTYLQQQKSKVQGQGAGHLPCVHT